MEQCAIALGMFDGVHIGHRAVLQSAMNSGFKSIAVTFDSLPFKSGGILMTPQIKEEALKAFGIDEVRFLNFEEVKDLVPIEFLNRLCHKYNVGKIVCGFNYRFGRKAEGTTEFLREYCEERGIIFDEIPPVTHNGVTVSSTFIKELLNNGEVEKVETLLTTPFYFKAKVEEGDKRGRTIDFPTANQIYPKNYVALKNGVYQTVVTVDGKEYDSVTNIGFRPTYPTSNVTAETYILNYSGDCYGKEIKVKVVKFLRDEKKFGSLEELKKAVGENVDYVKTNSKANK